MYITTLFSNISKLIEKKLICEDVTDKTINETIYKSALLLGVQGFRSYTQAAKELGISKTYLGYLLHTYKDIIGKPFHHPIFGKNNLLSIYQLEKLAFLMPKNQ